MRIQSEGALGGGKMLRFAGHPHWHVRKQPMARSNLKIYRGPAEKQAPTRPASNNQAATVTVELSEVLPLLADAVASRRTWLSDFEDDQITISADLYEVLLAYQYYRHPAA
jgi:hypothetical protein